MADVVDQAQRHEAAFLARAIRAARLAVPIGAPGICDDCGDESQRLVGGRCAPCREPRPRIPRRR